LKKKEVSFFAFFLLFAQPIFMTSNLAIARGASGFIPPVSLAFWRWLLAFLIFLPFVFPSIRKNFKD
jgi:drug/metabolite transporter (DMT)-like permease